MDALISENTTIEPKALKPISPIEIIKRVDSILACLTNKKYASLAITTTRLPYESQIAELQEAASLIHQLCLAQS